MLQFDKLCMTPCAKIIVGLVAHFGNVFVIKRLLTFLYIFHVFDVFFYLNVYFFHGCCYSSGNNWRVAFDTVYV